MGYTGLKLDGGREMRKSLRKAGYDLKNLRETHREVATVVIGKAKVLVPRRPGSGRLAATIRVGATQEAAITRAGNNRKGKSGVPYGNPIHWGWKKKNIKPNPFFFNAAKETQPKWLRLYEKAVNKAIEQVKGV